MTINDIKAPFASQGDRLPISYPATQNGVISWLTGYTYLYELKPNETPLDPYILRPEFNEVFYLTTAKMLDIESKLGTSLQDGLDTKVDKVDYANDKRFFVTTNTTQSVSGDKTFTGNVYSNKNPTSANQIVNKTYADSKVSLNGNQTINGVKTFTQLPISSNTPTNDNQLTNLKFVNTKVSLNGNQTINGIKTFSQAPRSNAAPSNNNDLVRLIDLNNKGLGINQTWRDVTSRRQSGVTYYNTTGKPIMVCVTRVTGLGTDEITFYVNGSEVIRNGSTEYNDRSIYVGLSVIVPVGASYRVEIYGVLNQYIYLWEELR